MTLGELQMRGKFWKPQEYGTSAIVEVSRGAPEALPAVVRLRACLLDAVRLSNEAKVSLDIEAADLCRQMERRQASVAGSGK